MKKKRKKKQGNRPGKTNAEAFKTAAAHEQAGRLEAAENAYRRLLKTAPGDARAWFNLGNVLVRRDRPDQAAKAFEKAAEHAPDLALVQIHLGNVRYLQARLDAALAAFQRALALNSNAPEAHMGLAAVFRRTDRIEEAIKALEKAIEGAPDRIGLYGNLASLLHRQGRTPEAVSVLRRAVARAPDDQALCHRLAALSGKSTEAAPDRFVIETFDSMSSTFDRHLVKDLGYRTPEALCRLLADHCGSRAPFQAMVDLGCGTGLSGQAFAAMARCIDGIDLSPRMLEKSREKGIYRRLMRGGIAEVLHRSETAYDLFVAADVFVYIGNLDPVFAAIGRRARENALAVFSTESGDSDAWVLRPTGRYAHGRRYVERLAGNHGFSVLESRREKIRKERNEWITGDLFLLTRDPTAPVKG